MDASVASTSRAGLTAPTSETAVLDPQVYSLVESARRAIRECVTGAEAETDGSPLDGRQLKTCAPCKAVKVRCSGSPGETCQRCATKGILCEYPQARKLGRRATNRKTLKLYDLQRDIDRLHLLLTRRSALPPHVASNLPSNVRSVAGSGAVATTDEGDEDDEDDEDVDPLLSVLSNPLGLLTLTDEPVSTPSTSGPDSEMGTTDLFQHRLLTLWFDHLQQYLFLLDPALHTPMFLRRTSPFLTTVIACVVAPFDPRSAHLVDALVQHANYLSARVFTHGFKSLEVVLAYCLWAPWSPVSKVPAADRIWSYISQASRLASEIRLDLPLQPAVIEHASSQTGRIQLMMSVHGTQALAACSCMATGQEARSRLSKPAAKILDLHVSNLLISQLFAKALILHSTLQRREPSDTRDPQAVFNDSWKRDFAEWDHQFAHIKELPYLSRLNRHILLLSYSLHFPGRVQPILEECRQVALKAAQYVQEWLAADPGLVYASNFTQLDIMAQTPLPDWFATEQSFEQLFSWMPMSTDEWDVFSGLGGAAGGNHLRK
ncbi:hypothetical protein Rhopal_006289-T1 [Rhodotorula paludigena]|uniref:Zn(2)-C6 fungal-type domain-containing protein n=1 Tax=Rhodotorula paludigena TaxID=86838 RepID=A0AAV5GUS5_9BASI|nr:hypothetical protein Rhopal_006289-T1 [Rhodotorula paludigena]